MEVLVPLIILAVVFVVVFAIREVHNKGSAQAAAAGAEATLKTAMDGIGSHIKTVLDGFISHAQSNAATVQAVMAAHAQTVVAAVAQPVAVTLAAPAASVIPDKPTVLTPAAPRDPHLFGFSKPTDVMPDGYWCAIGGVAPDGMKFAQDVGRIPGTPSGNSNPGSYIVNAAVVHLENGAFVPGEAPAA